MANRNRRRNGGNNNNGGNSNGGNNSGGNNSGGNNSGGNNSGGNNSGGNNSGGNNSGGHNNSGNNNGANYHGNNGGYQGRNFDPNYQNRFNNNNGRNGNGGNFNGPNGGNNGNANHRNNRGSGFDMSLSPIYSMLQSASRNTRNRRPGQPIPQINITPPTPSSSWTNPLTQQPRNQGQRGGPCLWQSLVESVDAEGDVFMCDCNGYVPMCALRAVAIANAQRAKLQMAMSMNHGLQMALAERGGSWDIC